jgi:hypothetical protein
LSLTACINWSRTCRVISSICLRACEEPSSVLAFGSSYVCVCVCVCVYIYICMYVYIYICMYVCMYVCMYIYVYVYMPALLHISVGVELDSLAIHAHRRGFDYERPLQPHGRAAVAASIRQHTSACVSTRQPLMQDLRAHGEQQAVPLERQPPVIRMLPQVLIVSAWSRIIPQVLIVSAWSRIMYNIHNTLSTRLKKQYIYIYIYIYIHDTYI